MQFLNLTGTRTHGEGQNQFLTTPGLGKTIVATL